MRSAWVVMGSGGRFGVGFGWCMGWMEFCWASGCIGGYKMVMDTGVQWRSALQEGFDIGQVHHHFHHRIAG